MNFSEWRAKVESAKQNYDEVFKAAKQAAQSKLCELDLMEEEVLNRVYAPDDEHVRQNDIECNNARLKEVSDFLAWLSKD